MSLIFKRTKILATLGPSTNTPEIVEQLITAGVNGFRLNFSHGSYEERDEQLPWIREASKKAGKPVAILQDLQGPKIRLGNLQENTEVKKGDEIVLDYSAEHSGLTFPVQYNLASKVKVGEPIYIFDGIKIPEEYSTLINPERNIPYYITGLTGITNEMVENAPCFYNC